MPKTETPATTTNGTTKAVSPADIDEKTLYLDGATGGSSPEADALAIVARIFSAESADDVFAGPGSMLGAEDLVGKAFTLTDVEYRESDIKPTPQNPNPGPGVYALLHISPWGSADTQLVSCGARNVMAAAFRGKQLGALPRGPMTIVEGKTTRQGFTPLWLQDTDRAKADAENGISNVKSRTGDETF